MKKEKIQITWKGKEIPVRIVKANGYEMFCISDIIRAETSKVNDTVKNYLRNKGNINFLGEWEAANNIEDFNKVGFDLIKLRTGDSNFTLSVSEWIRQTNAKGIISERGKYGGVYAHKEVAIQFTTWFNAAFYVRFIKFFTELAAKEKMSAEFYLNKIFNSTLEANQLSKFLLDGQKIIEEE